MTTTLRATFAPSALGEGRGEGRHGPFPTLVRQLAVAAQFLARLLVAGHLDDHDLALRAQCRDRLRERGLLARGREDRAARRALARDRREAPQVHREAGRRPRAPEARAD